MRTPTNNNIISICGVKNDGKTTLGSFFMMKLDKPSVIIDIAEQFTENKAYRLILKGAKAFKVFFSSYKRRRAFYKGKLQIIYRFSTEDTKKEVEEIFSFMNKSLRNITIFCEEMELYADSYLNKNSSIFKTVYLSRNRNFDLICVIKNIGSFSKLIKEATDLWAIGNIKHVSSKKFFNENSNNRFDIEHKKCNFSNRDFLITNLHGFYTVFALKKQILKYI